MHDDPKKYLSEDSLPEDTNICEPLKLTLSQIVKLWNHWRQQQRNGEHGLEFIYAHPQDQREGPDCKGKKKAVNRVDPQNDDSPSPGTPALDNNNGSSPGTPPSFSHSRSPVQPVSGPSNSHNHSNNEASQGLDENSPANHHGSK